jgi:hypothetical protein
MFSGGITHEVTVAVLRTASGTNLASQKQQLYIFAGAG